MEQGSYLEWSLQSITDPTLYGGPGHTRIDLVSLSTAKYYRTLNLGTPALAASRKAIPTRLGVRDQTRQLVIVIKHHTVRPGRTPRIRLVRGQNRELVVRRLYGEIEVLVVVVDVWVVAAANGLVLLVVIVAGLFGSVGVIAGVAVTATGVVARAGLNVLGEGQGGLDEEERGESEDLGSQHP